MPFAHIGDVEIFFDETGSGEPLLMIQGLGYDHRPYAWLREILSRELRTIAHDNRGAGLSGKPEGDYTIDEIATDAVGLLDHLGIERASVMGVSLGGYVAQTIAVGHPNRISRLVLGCTFFSGNPERIRMPASTLAILLERKGTAEEIARRGLGTAFSNRFPARRPDVFETLVRWRVESPIPLHGYMGQLKAGMAFDLEGSVGTIRTPTLVIHGDEDAVVPVDRGRELHAAIPGSRLEILPGAGHLFFIEEAERTASLVLGFVRGG